MKTAKNGAHLLQSNQEPKQMKYKPKKQKKMSQKTYTLTQLIEAVNNYNYRLCEVLTQTGQRATKSHNIRVKPAKWLRDEVSAWIKRPQTEPGYYYLYCYTDAAKKNKPDVYPFVVGKPKNENLSEGAQPIPPAPIIIQQAQEKEHPLTWESALQYQNTISELRAQVSRLTIENDALKKQVEEFETLEEGEETAASGLLNENFLSGTVLPAINAFFDNQKQNRHLQFYQMAQQNPGLWQTPLGMQILFEQGASPGQMPTQQRQQPTQQQPAQNSQNKTIELANAFFDQLPDETFNEVEQIKNNSQDLNHFFTQLSEINPGLFEACQAFINSNGGQL